MALFIKAKNGNVVETDDTGLAKRAIVQGHEVFTSDPNAKGAKPKAWDPDAEADEAPADDDTK